MVDRRAALRGDASNPADQARGERLRKARQEQLTLVRTSAAKWQAGLATLLGMITVSWTFELGEQLRGIRPVWTLVIVVLLAASVAGSMVSLILSLRASGGFPKARATTKLDVEALDHTEAAASTGYLATAVFWAVASFLLYLAVVGAVWFAPRKDSQPSVFVMTVNGQVVCGDVTAVLGDDLFVSKPDGDSRRVDASDLTSLVVADSCP